MFTNLQGPSRYFLAVIAVVLAIACRLLLDPLLNERLPFIMLFGAVAFTAWYGGRGPALLALTLGSIGMAYLFIEPRYSLAIARQEYVVGLILYWTIGLGCTLLFEQLQHARRMAELNAEQAQQKQQELQAEVTRRVQAEAELRAVDRRKDVFLTTLAHELRNPLAPLGNTINRLLMDPPDTAQVRQAALLMRRQIQHLSRLLDDLLEVSRIRYGKILLRKERLELETVLSDAIEQNRPHLEARGQKLSVRLPEQPIILYADLTRLSQVFVNLLNNSSKFTPDGGQIWLTAEWRQGELIVSVRDSGIGIPAEELPLLFKRFSQLGPTLERSQGGLGIGLSLVRELVELHGGRVEAHSAGKDQGSEFVVHLPLDKIPPTDETTVLSPSAPSAALRILVTDDNQESADSMAWLLRLRGHEVRTAYDGEETLQITEEFQPEVLLLDIGLPRKNGYEVAHLLRQNAAIRQPMLIAMTGWGREPDRQKTREAGFDHHLTKPVDLESLEELLQFKGGVPFSETLRQR